MLYLKYYCLFLLFLPSVIGVRSPCERNFQFICIRCSLEMKINYCFLLVINVDMRFSSLYFLFSKDCKELKFVNCRLCSTAAAMIFLSFYI